MKHVVHKCGGLTDGWTPDLATHEFDIKGKIVSENKFEDTPFDDLLDLLKPELNTFSKCDFSTNLYVCSIGGGSKLYPGDTTFHSEKNYHEGRNANTKNIVDALQKFLSILKQQGYSNLKWRSHITKTKKEKKTLFMRRLKERFTGVYFDLFLEGRMTKEHLKKYPIADPFDIEDEEMRNWVCSKESQSQDFFEIALEIEQKEEF